MYFYQYAQLPLIADCSFILICPVSISCLQYLQLGIPLYSCTHFPSTHSVGGFPQFWTFMLLEVNSFLLCETYG